MFPPFKYIIILFLSLNFQVFSQNNIKKTNELLFDSLFEVSLHEYFKANYTESMTALLVTEKYFSEVDKDRKISFLEMKRNVYFGQRDFLNMYLSNADLYKLLENENNLVGMLNCRVNEGIINRECNQYQKAELIFVDILSELKKLEAQIGSNVELQAVNIWTLLHLSHLYVLENKLDSAEIMISQGLGLMGKYEILKMIDVHFYFESAAIAFKRGEINSARIIYKQILDILKSRTYMDYDKYIDINISLADIYLEEKDTVTALNMYKKCLYQADSVGIEKYSFLTAEKIYDVDKNFFKDDTKLNAKIIDIFRQEIKHSKRQFGIVNNLVTKQEEIETLNSFLNLQNEKLKLKDRNNKLLIIIIVLFGLVIISNVYLLRNRAKSFKKITDLFSKLETANNSLANSNRKLKILNHNVNKFSSLVAHDIKSPLRNIISINQILFSGLSNDVNNEKLEFVELIKSEILSLEIFIDDLLKFTQLTNDFDIKLEKLDLKEIIMAALDRNRTDLESNQMNVNVDLNNTILGSKVILIQCFQNFISNSIKFRSTVRQSEITISSSLVRNQVVLMFKDNGIGIDKESMSVIFKSRARAKNAKNKKIDGYGLGLSTVKNILDIHGATISLDSVEDEFTAFYITFPKES